MKGTLRTKARMSEDSIHFYANMKPRFKRCSKDHCKHRYSFDDVIDDTVSYYIMIGIPFGLRRRCGEHTTMMRRFKYNNDIRTLRDFTW